VNAFITGIFTVFGRDRDGIRFVGKGQLEVQAWLKWARLRVDDLAEAGDVGDLILAHTKPARICDGSKRDEGCPQHQDSAVDAHSTEPRGKDWHGHEQMQLA
jgi:hypothetical protein